jgi:predicted nuclease of predicted toxin-antitoxin system
MSLRIVVDMNLSVEWIPALEEAGWSAVHRSAIGDPHADDATVMAWALAQGHAVFTHDLDFGTALALTEKGDKSNLQQAAWRRSGEVGKLDLFPFPVVLAALRAVRN